MLVKSRNNSVVITSDFDGHGSSGVIKVTLNNRNLPELASACIELFTYKDGTARLNVRTEDLLRLRHFLRASFWQIDSVLTGDYKE